MNINLSYSTTCFGPERQPDDLLTWLKMLHSAGFSRVELSRKHNSLGRRRREIERLGIDVWAVHGNLGNMVLSDDPEECARAIETEIERMRDAAPFAPCPYVIHYLDRFNDPVYGRRFRHAIEQLVEANEQFGFILAIETAPYKPLINERYPDSREIAEFVRSFNSDKVQMTVDINHSNLNEDLIKVCQHCRGLIANIHVSDNHGKCEEHLIPGDGIIPVKAVLEELRRCGYNGPCNLELHLSSLPDQDALVKLHRHMEKLLS
jgi:sugar phosphate isomerase/epimerase